MTDTDQTTIIPCPPWCTLPAGHEPESEFDGTATRLHLGERGQVDTWRGPDAAQVQLAQVEESSPAGSRLIEELGIGILGYVEADDLTGPQARQLAAHLLNAADEWDRITGASS